MFSRDMIGAQVVHAYSKIGLIMEGFFVFTPKCSNQCFVYFHGLVGFFLHFLYVLQNED